MLFIITVWRELGNKRKKIYSNEVTARDPVQALEKSCVRFSRDRIVEIRMVDQVIERPPVKRISRDALS